ncbi:hypothetical protein CRE_04200 [Caenorhabditis remanei]|uniref:F-box domain-containing protein n=1 Tax=Caenorhabditis remanei TaxID=31234 RepID=E3MYZ0_CAERE|nr:hypothetical protein CRE_04200 [Caenorhabditis remanei]
MSEVSKPLPLFRLPTVLLRKISGYMHLREILLISLTSKKSAYIIQALLPPISFEMQLSLYSHIYIALGNKDSWDPVVFKAQHSGSFSYRGDEKELEKVVKFLLSHFALVFNPTMQEVSFDEGCSQKLMISVLKHVKRVNRVAATEIGEISISPENYKYILDEFREIPRLALNCKVASDFRYRTDRHLFKVEDFIVDDGHWMHLEDFTNCKMVTVNIENHMYPNISVMLRTFIEKWIDSADWRLEQLEVCSYLAPINLSEVLVGVEYSTVELNEQSETIEITKKSDGRKATVKCGEISFEFKVID